jgi:hypothetical protein
MGTHKAGAVETTLPGLAVQGVRVSLRAGKTAGGLPGMQGKAGQVRKIYVMNLPCWHLFYQVFAFSNREVDFLIGNNLPF